MTGIIIIMKLFVLVAFERGWQCERDNEDEDDNENSQAKLGRERMESQKAVIHRQLPVASGCFGTSNCELVVANLHHVRAVSHLLCVLSPNFHGIARATVFPAVNPKGIKSKHTAWSTLGPAAPGTLSQSHANQSPNMVTVRE